MTDFYKQNLQAVVAGNKQERDDRAEHRSRVLKRGMIGFGEQYASQPCIIRDMNSNGAKLELQNIIALPKTFTLHIEIEGIQVECQLAWQKPPFAGVAFTSERRPSTLARKQTLRDSDSALSSQFLQDFEQRQAREHANQPSQSSHDPAAARARRNAAKPVTFGKRSFNG